MRRAAVLFGVLFTWSVAAIAQRGAPGGQWPTYGGDAGSTKYAPLDQITRDNVSQLHVVWRWESPDNAIVAENRRSLPMLPAAFKATPIMVNGILYIKTAMSEAAAIDAATGKRLWVFDPETWRRERPANTGFNSRGVAYWTDGRVSRIFLPTGDAHLWSLDAKTGRPDDKFGSNGSVDATLGMRRPVAAQRPPADVGAARGRRRGGDRIGRERRTALSARAAGRSAGIRRADRPRAVAVPHDPADR